MAVCPLRRVREWSPRERVSMATLFSVNNNSIDLSTFDLATITQGPPTTKTASDFVLPNAEFKGFNFQYDINDPNNLIGGTITDIIVTTGGQQRYQITGLLLPVSDVNFFIDNGNDSQGFLADVFSETDTLNGSTVADHLLGFGSSDTIEGNGGNDTLEGGDGNDRLDGNANNDSLAGNAGSDTLDGGAGNDSMDGGVGNDQYFVDSASDVTKDTGPGTDIDTVKSTLVSTTIDSSIENLTLLDTAVSGTGNASNNVLTGDDLANTLNGAGGDDTMQGGKGNDTYIVDSLGDQVIETLSAAAGGGTDLVQSSVSFTLGANVDNLTLTADKTADGTGNDIKNVITGNDADNLLRGFGDHDTLSGGLGDDTLDGGTGNDRMLGGDGDDLFIVDSVLDTVVENNSQGIDKVQSSVSFVLGVTVEDLTLTGILDINGTGSSFTNHIVGNSGKNILDGKTNDLNLGGDTLDGGGNDDTYIVHNKGDQVIEAVDSGHDTIQSFITFSLAANVEDLVLTGTAAINGTGNELANKLTGDAAANKLDGGLGDDTMIGGLGDDGYVIDSAKDVITELKNGGNDEVFFTGTGQTLVKLYTEIEHYNFSLLDPAALAVNFTGTTVANRITGTTFDDTLSGGTGDDTLNGGDGKDSLNGGIGNDRLDGGAGDDTMDGGAGKDTYVINDYTDKIIETGKDIGDTVETGVAGKHIDLNQAIFAGIENVTFTGTEDLNATGTDTVANLLTGNAGDNLLEGEGANDTLLGGGGVDTLDGGKGNDSMAGGTGDDIYLVDSLSDKILENAGAGTGTDLVTSVLSYVLGANLEQLVLVGGDLNGTGNGEDNVIVGTNGKNILDGKVGEDVLSGQGGDDTYVVDNAKDQVIESKDGGHDLVKSTVTYSIATSDNVEDLTLIGGSHIDGTGNDLDNVLTGNGAFNKLDGGIGADTMKGLAGDDTYSVDNIGDKVDETGGSGLNDTIIVEVLDPTKEKGIADQLTKSPVSGVEHYDFSKLTTDVHLNFAGDAASNKLIGTKFDDTLTGNGGNDTLDGGLGADSLTGGLGNDTYVIDTLADTIVELKNGGTDTIVSRLADYTLQEPSLNYNFENLTIDLNAGPADATGNSLANVIRGNVFANELKGLGGNDTMFAAEGDDTLDGGAGNDSMAGSFGDDTYILDSKSDRVVEAVGFGLDTVIAPFDYTLLANFDNLVLTGNAKIGTGNDLGNNIFGNDLDNTLDGKGGIDHYEGGKGNDLYILRSIAETVFEKAGEGIDTVKTSWKEHHLADNVENLFFTVGFHNSGFGNASDNLIVGNVVSDTLRGDFGNDTLDGGAGADVLIGGNDNDTYIVDNAGDVIQEFPGSGIDTLQAKISIDLALYKNAGLDVIENVTLIGAGTLSATGNALDNQLMGGSGANKLIGNDGNDTLDGGLGGDSMVGGIGNDTYIVDNAADKVDETGGTGTDTVLSSVTFNFTANGTTVKGDFENLTLTGTGAVNGTGNAFNNIIHGNDGANKLDGGLGNDTLTGGLGNDTVTGGGGNDQIDTADGNDTVRFTSVLDGHDVISNFDGDATGGQDTVDLDALFDSLFIAGADRAGRVIFTPGSGTVDVSVDASALHDGSNIVAVATLNTNDAITVGQDVLVGA
jgi:Ca2+-binding RTX toxin-like protein